MDQTETANGFKNAVRPLLEKFLVNPKGTIKAALGVLGAFKAAGGTVEAPAPAPELDPEEAALMEQIESGAAMSIQASFRGRQTRREAEERRRKEEIIVETESERAVKQSEAGAEAELRQQAEAAEAAREQRDAARAAADAADAAAFASDEQEEEGDADMVARILAEEAEEAAEEEAADRLKLEADAIMESVITAAAAEAHRLKRVAMMTETVSALKKDDADASTVNSTFATLKKVQDKWAPKAGAPNTGGEAPPAPAKGMTMKEMRAQARAGKQPEKKKARGVSFAPTEEDSDDDEDEEEEVEREVVASSGVGMDIRKPVSYHEELGASDQEAMELQATEALLEETEVRLAKARSGERDRIAQLEQAQVEADELLERLQKEMGSLSGGSPNYRGSLTEPLPPSRSKFDTATTGSLEGGFEGLVQVSVTFVPSQGDSKGWF